MLLLTRMVDEEILIGDDIIVKVCRIDDDKVRLGIAAPRGVSVDRREVRESKLREGERTDGIDHKG